MPSPFRLRPTLEPLGDRLAPATLPATFTETLVAGGITGPTAFARTPDGDFLVAEQDGTLLTVDGVTGETATALQLTVDSTGERGLIGVTLDPNYATNRLVYVTYTVPAANGAAPFNRVSRFDLTPNGIVPPGSVEQVIVNLDPLTSATNHNGGPLAFGPDGKLYVAVGDNNTGANAQSAANRLGKILRLNPDGTIPSDNPATVAGIGATAGANRAIWAAGLRNPFSLEFTPAGLLVNDVGQSTFEEVNRVAAGANFGWPATEGDFDQAAFPNFTRPLYAYPHTGPELFSGIAVTGGAAVDLQGAGTAYFFADFVSGWVNRLDLGSGAVTNFASDLTGGLIVDLTDGDNGFFYLARGGPNGGAIYEIAAPIVDPPPGNPPPVTPSTPVPLPLAVGAGSGGEVRLVNADGSTAATLQPFGSGFTGGVRVAAGAFGATPQAGVAAVTGPGGGPRLVVVSSNGVTLRDVLVFEESFRGGLFVAAGDVNGDGVDDLAVSADVGGGPRVKVVDGATGATLADFFAFADDPNFRGGARVALGDFNADGVADLAVAAGVGGGPRVALFDGRTLRSGTSPARLVNDFFVFEESVRNGAYVAAGNPNGTGARDSLYAGGGPGGGPRVVGFDAAELLAGRVVPFTSFFAGDPADRGGAPVASRNVDAVPGEEVVVGTPAGEAPTVRAFRGTADSGGTEVESFDAFGGTGGVFVG